MNETTPTTAPAATWISRRDLQARTGLSSVTLWRLVRCGALPAPVHLSPRRVAWPVDVILRWELERRVVPGTEAREPKLAASR